ncbi:unnamed protein product [Ectocarpus sp. 13 AM-2016]
MNTIHHHCPSFPLAIYCSFERRRERCLCRSILGALRIMSALDKEASFSGKHGFRLKFSCRKGLSDGPSSGSRGKKNNEYLICLQVHRPKNTRHDLQNPKSRCVER